MIVFCLHMMQYWLPKNQAIVRKALTKAGRLDLIGYEKKCLVRPESKNDKLKMTGQKAGRPKNNVKKKVRR